MRKIYPIFLGGMLCLPCCFFAESAAAQVQTPRYISTGPNSNGFYEYLPAGYSTGSTRYPLMVFIHGDGELGNGGSDLPLVLRHGPPQLINEGKFPASFTVNGQTFSFIVISPQFIAAPTDSDVAHVINYAMENYRVDTGRIYLTGLSMGGGATWGYAGEVGHASLLAAAVPIAAGIFWYGEAGARIIAAADLPIFAAANLNDPVEPSSGTINAINMINSVVPHIDPPALDTIYNASGHGGWNQTYDPDSAMHNGLNIYQWMLQYTRDSVQSFVPLPVTLTAFTAALGPGGSQVDLAWTTASEENDHYFIVQRSSGGQPFEDLDTVKAAAGANNGHAYAAVDTRPLPGQDDYRLAQVDMDGKTTYSGIDKVTVGQGPEGLYIGPNPAEGALYIELRNGFSGPGEMRIVDLSGRIWISLLFQKTGAVCSQTIDVGRLAPGSYFIQVLGKGYSQVKTFIRK